MNKKTRVRISHNIIGTVTDYAGRFWCVYQSRATEHGWQVLLGRPSVDDGGNIPLKGGLATIITQELADYFKEHRLLRSPIRLPISKTVIHRIRQELGINFHIDYPLWWEQAQSEIVRQDGIPPHIEFAVSDCPKNWTKDELREFLSLRMEGKTLSEVADQMNKKIRAVDALHRKLLGIKKFQRPWTESAVERLLTLKKEGYSHLEISKRMQRSLAAVEGMLARLLPGRGKAGAWGEDEREALIRLTREGVTPQQIAKILGRTYHAVIVMRRKLTTIAKQPRWTAEDRSKLQKLLRTGLTQGEAAVLLGRSEQAVWHMCSQMRKAQR